MKLRLLDPGYLDARGLVAPWQEGILAMAIGRGRARGYRNHPQPVRFRNHPRPVAALNDYLHHVLHEAQRRGYRFDASKISPFAHADSITVSLPDIFYSEDVRTQNFTELR